MKYKFYMAFDKLRKPRTLSKFWSVFNLAVLCCFCACFFSYMSTYAQRPTINTFSPASGPVGTSVTISGTQFNTTAAQNIVFFGATRATVTFASPTTTSLTVTVPAGATYQAITVLNTATGLTGSSASPFIVTFDGLLTPTSFNPKVDFTTGSRPESVSIGDLDGDGKPDLAVANYLSNTVSVFRNTSSSGSISIAAEVDFTTGSTPTSVSIGDLDGDGKPDLAVANSVSNTISVFRNTSISGSISFATKVDFTTGLNPINVSIGDLDGDGKPDLAVANFSSYTVSVFRNTSTSGSISFANKVDFTTGTDPNSVSIGDLDGDGKPDLAVANYLSNTVSVFHNTSMSGSISFAPKADFTTGSQPRSVSIGDLDGDGKPDLAVANYNSNTVSAFRNTATSGSISFATKVDFATGSTPTSVSIGDLDGDGKPDLAVANSGSNSVSALLNTSTSGSITATSFATKVDFTTGTGPASFSIGDLDGDGKSEMVVANYFSNTLSILKNNPILPPSIISFSPISGIIGSSVVITGKYFNTLPAQNFVFFGATQAIVTAASTTSLTVTVPSGATHQPITVLNTATGLTGSSASPFIVTFDGLLTPTSFNPKVDFTTGSSPNSVSIGDLDGDGKTDLAVANRSSNTVSVFRNTSTSGSISFAPKVDFTTGTSPFSVSIGDLDGDGKTDLAVANYNSNTVSVFRNTSTSGSISFATKVDFTTGSSPNSVSIGDLDGDGKTDLAVANRSSNTVSVFRNTSTSGSISFAPKVDFITLTEPFSVSIGDLDGDGKTDLAVTNYLSLSVSIFRNTSTSGSISFATKVDFTTGTSPSSVSIGDLDGDGKTDLAVANTGSNTVSVFRNTSTSGSITATSFATKVDFTTGTGPASFSIGDLDGDGKSEMVVANYFSNTVSIFKNNPIFPPNVSSFSPISGAIGSSVVITGKYFNTSAAQNFVFFGATQAIVTAASTTSLTVTVPSGATHQPIAVLNIATNLSGNSNQPFKVTFVGFIASNSIIPKVDFTTGATPASSIIGDLDGDGKPDLAVVNFTSNTVSVYRNTSAVGSINVSSFSSKIDFATGLSPQSISFGDLDGDGKPELVVANSSSNSVSVFRNTSSVGSINSTSFASKIDFMTGAYPISVSIGDLDRDGKPDLAVANFNTNSISIFRNTSIVGSINSGSFAGKVDFTTGSIPYSVSIGDLDGDGKLDLAVANSGSNTISVFRNTSFSALINTGSFASKVDFSTGSFPSSVSIGDLDGDGKPDLAVANVNSNSVSVLRNTSLLGAIGTSSFAGKVDFTAGTSPLYISIGDLDGDGKPDMAVANWQSKTLSVFQNTSTSGSISTGSFASKVDFTTGTNPSSVSIGDLDGDGKPDIAVANDGSNSISILKLKTNVYVFTGDGNWSVPSNWTNNTPPPAVLMSGDLIVINPSGKCNTDITYHVTAGANLLIVPGKVFKINPVFSF